MLVVGGLEKNKLAFLFLLMLNLCRRCYIILMVHFHIWVCFWKKILFYCSRNELNKDLVIIIEFGASSAEIKLFFQILQTQICKCTLPDQQQQQCADVKRASITKMKNQSIKVSFNSIKKHIMYLQLHICCNSE